MKCRRITWLLIFISAAATATPQVNVSESTYDIQGTTASEMREQMNLLGPMEALSHYDAFTHWTVNWHFKYLEETPVCRITQATVTADIQHVYPHWSNYQSASKLLQMRWDEYLNRLKAHEENHSSHAKSAAYEVENSLLSLPPDRSCQQLAINANNLAQKILSEHTSLDHQYDITTRHGQNEGAIFP